VNRKHEARLPEKKPNLETVSGVRKASNGGACGLFSGVIFRSCRGIFQCTGNTRPVYRKKT
jgi:hypothetical protein